jgi:hypothetical protein
MTVMNVSRSPWALPRTARALRLEFKRNAVPYLLPLLAAVFYFDTIRSADGFPPVWTLRSSVIGDDMLVEFSGIQTSTGGDAVLWRQTFQTALLDAFLTGTGPSLTAPSQQMGPAVVLNAAQQAVENALMTAAGSPPQHIFSEMGGKPGSGTVAALSAATQRFGRLSASARRAWLAAHLTALRAGTITVAQIP